MVKKLWSISVAFVTLLLTSCNEQTPDADGQTDPVLVEYPIVYIERSIIKQDDDAIDPVTFSARNPVEFNPGAKLYIKNNAFADSPSIVISDTLFVEESDAESTEISSNQAIDIRDLSIADDGQSFLVSIRAPEIENADDEDQPKWNIWRYQLADKSFDRVITSEVTAEQGHDLMPSFLPDGRIVFASTRQRLSRAILLDEGKAQYSAVNETGQDTALNLHVMQADGTDIQQISFNMSHDFYPLVLQDGRILYSRWDAMGGNNKINLYRMNPDGTENQLVYGWHSHQITLDDENESIEFIKPQQLPNGNILMLLASSDDEVYQKRPVTINIEQYIDYQQAISEQSLVEPAQQDLFTESTFNFNFSEQINSAGRLNHLFPLPDQSERYLLSWDLCRVVVADEIKACGQLTEAELASEEVSHAEPWYELWLYNATQNTQQLVAKTSTGNMLTEAVVLQASQQPAEFVADKTFGAGLTAGLANEQAGAIHIRSVYDFDGIDTSIEEGNEQGIAQLRDPSLTAASDLSARFLRIVRGVPMPPREVRQVNNTDFGRSRNQLMREIIGYAPIQPDGSVKVKVPANVPFAISILDGSGQRIGGRHRQWLSVRAGETLECNGCHTEQSELPHGRLEAQANSINLGATGGVSFTNTSETIIPLNGQTMAEADEMVNGLAQLSADLQYNDIWTNTDISAINPEIDLSYQAIETLPPNGSGCFSNWNAYCRLQINYEEHIQPLWLLNREVYDSVTEELLADNTCTSCHAPIDADSLSQIPAGQLDLTDSVSTDETAHVTSYRELLFNDTEQELIDGIVIDRLVEVLDAQGNVVYEVNLEGELLLDAEGNTIPVLTTVNVPAILSTNGALSSNSFFELFAEGRHQGMLSQDELRLLSEWLDIGAQYYNTPFYSLD